MEFIIPKFFKGSTCFERHTAHHQELINQRLQIEFRAPYDERCAARNMLSL